MPANGIQEHNGLSPIPVAYLILGYENNRKAVIDFIRNATTKLNFVSDAIQPTVGSKIDWLWEEISDVREKGAKCRQIADITQDNLSYCKKNMARLDEFRHLSGISINFGVSDIEALVIVPSFAPREEHTIQFIHSDAESVVEYKRRCFDLLWGRATPVQSRIAELEGKSVDLVAASTNVIDRIYVCKNCHQTFIYVSEVEDHRNTKRHVNYHEYPLV